MVYFVIKAFHGDWRLFLLTKDSWFVKSPMKSEQIDTCFLSSNNTWAIIVCNQMYFKLTSPLLQCEVFLCQVTDTGLAHIPFILFSYTSISSSWTHVTGEDHYTIKYFRCILQVDHRFRVPTTDLLSVEPWTAAKDTLNQCGGATSSCPECHVSHVSPWW